jgi:lipid II:glycine glycyltransferase (peptidoglycan interpeptide bridge formation enzyme)
VSLPFSDHCQPLTDNEGLQAILSYLDQRRMACRLKYVELRPATIEGMGLQGSFSPSERFLLQKIDLRNSLDTLYGGFHSSCIRRKIKRGEREGLVYESGRTAILLTKFRELLLLTRRRHKLPPQPASWFQNIVECLGSNVTIHLLSKDGTAVASIMTFAHKQVLTYKYGCSDASFSSLGGTPLLFWKVIQQAHAEGMKDFDLGRSGFEDPGLSTFKEHLGATSAELVYLRNPLSKPSSPATFPETKAWVRQALIQLPDPLFTGVGRLLYRHMG